MQKPPKVTLAFVDALNSLMAECLTVKPPEDPELVEVIVIHGNNFRITVEFSKDISKDLVETPSMN